MFEEVRIGSRLIARSLLCPLRLICINAGSSGPDIVREVYRSSDPRVGFDATTCSCEDLYSQGVVDSSTVVRSSVENSSSVSQSVLSIAEVLIH